MENFIVVTKQVKRKSKGLSNRSHYVIDNDRKDHLHTDITELVSYKTAAFNIRRNIEQRTSYRQKNGIRGGGIQNYATEYSFNLPPGHHLTNEQWNKLATKFIFETAKKLNLDYEELKKVCGYVVHRENGDKKDHMHFLMGNIVGKEFKKEITQRVTTTLAKTVWTEFLKTQLQIDPKTYTPNPENVGKNKPLWQARKDKEEQAYRVLETSKSLERSAQDLLAKIENQLAKFLLAVKENDQRQINRQSNRLKKSSEEAKNLEQALADNQELAKRLREAKAKIEGVRPKPTM